LFGDPQNVACTNGVEGKSAGPVTGKEKGTLRSFASRLRKRAFLVVSRINRRHKLSPLSSQITIDKKKLELALNYLEDGAVNSASFIIQRILAGKDGGSAV
jgi:hypothetical protein